MRRTRGAAIAAVTIAALVSTAGCSLLEGPDEQSGRGPGASARPSSDGLDGKDPEATTPPAGAETDSATSPGTGAGVETGTGSDSDPKPSEPMVAPSSPQPLPPQVLPQPASDALTGRDPEAVARAAVTTMWTYDTKVDSGPWDAELRAAPYLTPEFLDELRSSRPERSPGALWLYWESKFVYTQVELRPADLAGREPDTETAGHRSYRLELKVNTPLGDEPGPEAELVQVELRRADASAPWRVSAVSSS